MTEELSLVDINKVETAIERAEANRPSSVNLDTRLARALIDAYTGKDRSGQQITELEERIEELEGDLYREAHRANKAEDELRKHKKKAV